MRHANFERVDDETTPEVLVIRDLGPWDEHPTITNDAEYVVNLLWLDRMLDDGRRLVYYDSEGELAELVHEYGRFKGFWPCTPTEQRNR